MKSLLEAFRTDSIKSCRDLIGDILINLSAHEHVMNFYDFPNIFDFVCIWRMCLPRETRNCSFFHWRVMSDMGLILKNDVPSSKIFIKSVQSPFTDLRESIFPSTGTKNPHVDNNYNPRYLPRRRHSSRQASCGWVDKISSLHYSLYQRLLLWLFTWQIIFWSPLLHWSVCQFDANFQHFVDISVA